MFYSFIKKHPYQTLFLLGFYAIFLYLRAPDILIQGRFWAEEGNIFYANAWNMSPSHALFVVYGGYINLGASGATLIARYLYIPLEYAPYVTTFTGFLFQLTPIYLLLTAPDKWLQPFHTRVLATLLLLFIPESSEISLQSLHIQFHLALACTIIVFLNTHKKHQRYLKLFLLFWAPLCGLLPIVLIPIFIGKYLIEQDRLRLEQTIAIIIGGSIQMVFFLYNTQYNIDLNNVSITRNSHISFYDFCNVFYIRDLIFPFLGHRHQFALDMMGRIFVLVQDHKRSLQACVATFITFGIFISIFIKCPKTRPAIPLLISIILFSCVAIYGAIGGTVQLINPYFSERYTFISQALLSILILYFSVTLPYWGKIFVNIIILWLLIIGSYNFFQTFPEAKDGAGHIWQNELQKWRTDPNYHPKIWCSGWYIIIPKQLQDAKIDNP